MNKTPAVRFIGFAEDWEQRKLGEYVSITSGEAPSKFDKGTELYVKVDDLNYNDKYVVDTQNKVAEHSTVKRVTKGSVVFPKRGAAIMTNKVRIMGIDSYMDTNMMALTSEKLDSEFLYNIISKEGLYKIADTSTIPQINNKHVEPYEVTIPSLAEQRRIGAYFKQLDHLITLHQRKYDKLTNVKKSMLEKMFPKNGSNVPEIRFKGFTDAWEQRKLSEITTMHARIGWQNLRTSEFLDSGDYMLITGTDFNDGAINYSACHFVERERYEQDKHIQIKNGSILITKDGTLGKVAYVQGLSMPATLNAGVFNVEIKDETEVNDKYLFQYLKAPFLMDYVNKKATGGTIKHLNQNILVDFPVFMPSKAEQEEIGTYFEKLDHLITLHRRKLEKLEQIKQAMLHKMFV